MNPFLDAVRLLQGRVLGKTEAVHGQADLDVEMYALIQNAIRTSEIEGERLDVGSVRSSVARELGLEQDDLTTLITAPESEPEDVARAIR